jgi:hypothetical protein
MIAESLAFRPGLKGRACMPPDILLGAPEMLDRALVNPRIQRLDVRALVFLAA